MKSYVLIFDDEFGTHDKIKPWLTGELVYAWRYSIDNSFYLVSDKSADEIAQWLIAKSGRKGRFLVLEFTENSQGLLLKQDWHILQNKDLLADPSKK